MANPWFRFNQFLIRQDRCAMKVGTDGVILGAWTAVEGIRRALDVGTGTGLLALMLAQRNPELHIDGVEIDRDAAGQATENVKTSPFSNRINIHATSFQEYFSREHLPKYDLVICNPPFFSRSYYPANEPRSVARHDDRLKFPELIEGALKILGPGGKLSVVLPAETAETFIRLAVESGFKRHQILGVIPRPGKPPKRTCILLGLSDCDARVMPGEETLVIETGERHVYSEEYLALTREFYL